MICTVCGNHADDRICSSCVDLNEVNQCDGCQRGLPKIETVFGSLIHKGETPWDIIGCTAERYVSD